MYQKGEYVVCGSKGVCGIEDITTLDISGVDKERKYYILKPLYMAGSTVYVPVDTEEDSLRAVITGEEARQLIHTIPRIDPITITNDKLLEQEYKSCMKATCCEEWIRIIKTIYLRKQQRLEAGRKVTAVDARYERLAEDNLYGELAVALKMPKESVEAYITGEIDKEICV